MVRTGFFKAEFKEDRVDLLLFLFFGLNSPSSRCSGVRKTFIRDVYKKSETRDSKNTKADLVIQRTCQSQLLGGVSSAVFILILKKFRG